MIEPRKKTIDGLDFELSQLTAWRAMETLTRVTKYLAPGLDAISAAGKGSKEAGISALVKGLQGLSNNSPAELRALTEVLLESCVVTWEGKTARLLPAFDVVMQGRILTVFKLLAWALEENYADFFGVLKSGLGGLAAKKMEFASMLQSASSPSGPATE